MVYDFLSTHAVFHKDIKIPKRTSKIQKEILYFKTNMYRQATFMEGYHTVLKFPPEATGNITRQAQKMNYGYCVQTMAELMKKYAPEILN